MTGGIDDNGSLLDSAERYDPDKDQWIAQGSLNERRAGHSATVVDEMGDEVLILGGTTPSGVTRTTELYDAKNENFNSHLDCLEERTGHTATFVQQKELLIVGGLDKNGAPSEAIFRLELSNWKWTLAHLMPNGRHQHTTSELSDGRVLIAGGDDQFGMPVREVHVLESNSWTWTVQFLDKGRANHAAIPVRNGSALVVSGGYYHDGTIKAPFGQVDVLATAGFSQANYMSSARARHAAVELPSGQVLLIGGTEDGVTPSATTDILTLGDFWATTTNLQANRALHTLAPEGERILVAGGWDGAAAVASTELLSLTPTGTWAAAAGPPMQIPRAGHTSTPLPNAQVLIAGGENAAGPVASAEIFNFHSNTWSLAPPMPTPRRYHTATRLLTGNVLVAGGEDDDQLWGTSLIFSPAGGGSWSGSSTQMEEARHSHTATLLDDGRVLVVGGYTSGMRVTASADLYDPVNNKWTPMAIMQHPRVFHSATKLPDGSVLVAGGYDGRSTLGTVEIFLPPPLWAPGSGLWLSGPDTTPRDSHSSELLPTGEVLLAGGVDGLSPVNTAVLFNPSAGTWRSAASMLQTRYLQGTALLSNGEVLVSGGWNVSNGGTRNTNEAYIP